MAQFRDISDLSKAGLLNTTTNFVLNDKITRRKTNPYCLSSSCTKGIPKGELKRKLVKIKNDACVYCGDYVRYMTEDEK